MKRNITGLLSVLLAIALAVSPVSAASAPLAAAVLQEDDQLVNPFTDVAAGQYYYESVLWAVNRTPSVTKGTDATRFSPDAICTRGQVVAFLWRAAGEPEPSTAYNPFSDVKSGVYYYKAMIWAVEKGIAKGTGEKTFNPNAPCTRGQVVTFLHRAMDTPAAAGTAQPFADVSSSQFYYNAVLWAYNHDPQITTGTTGTTFSPNATCTRGQIVTFLYRAMA